MYKNQEGYSDPTAGAVYSTLRQAGAGGPGMTETTSQYPCRAESESSLEERWKDEIACTLIGCKDCKNFNGTEYYQANTRKGIAMWARKELEASQ